MIDSVLMLLGELDADNSRRGGRRRDHAQLQLLARTESCGVHLQHFYQLILLLLVAHNISLPTSAQKQQKRKKENKLQLQSGK